MFRFIRQNRYIPILIVVVLAFILRIYSISKLPPGLYDDEVAIGYNAYSILTRGTDEYGTPFPLTFRSFDDYKLPGYIYLDTVPIALFGKNAFAVRLPSAVSGTLTVLFLYLFLENLLSLESGQLRKKLRNLPLLSAFILAILPWHIQFSRAAYESVLALCFFMIGCWQSIVFYKNKRILYLLTSLFFFTLASYTYHSFRILTPIAFLLIFYFLFMKKFIKVKNLFLIALYVFILNLPLLIFTFGAHGTARFLQTSTFTKQALPESIQQALQTPIPKTPTAAVPQFSIQALLAYPFIYMQNFLSFFSLEELFVRGNDNVRFYSSSEFGFLFRWQLPFLIVGLLVLLREKSKILKKMVLSMLFITPAAVAIADSPNALHALLLVIPFSIIIALGINDIGQNSLRWVKLIFIGIIILGVYETGLYFHLYLSDYKDAYTVFWGGAQEKLVKEVTRYSKDYQTIVINETYLSNEKIYFLFYNDKLKPIFVDSSWQEPKSWNDKPFLYVRYPLTIPANSGMKLLENITLDVPSRNAVAQIIEL
jgi:4-amino-4-deoxy-L-arabinose transferase-like glycosyltransferase